MALSTPSRRAGYSRDRSRTMMVSRSPSTASGRWPSARTLLRTVGGTNCSSPRAPCSTNKDCSGESPSTSTKEEESTPKALGRNVDSYAEAGASLRRRRTGGQPANKKPTRLPPLLQTPLHAERIIAEGQRTAIRRGGGRRPKIFQIG